MNGDSLWGVREQREGGQEAKSWGEEERSIKLFLWWCHSVTYCFVCYKVKYFLLPRSAPSPPQPTCCYSRCHNDTRSAHLYRWLRSASWLLLSNALTHWPCWLVVWLLFILVTFPRSIHSPPADAKNWRMTVPKDLHPPSPAAFHPSWGLAFAGGYGKALLHRKFLQTVWQTSFRSTDIYISLLFIALPCEKGEMRSTLTLSHTGDGSILFLEAGCTNSTALCIPLPSLQFSFQKGGGGGQHSTESP